MLQILKHKGFCLIEHEEFNRRQKVSVYLFGQVIRLIINFVTCQHADGQRRCHNYVRIVKLLVQLEHNLAFFFL